ncbi:MAG TPA: hypothetical protein VNA89_03800, partial [Gemmatimonadaceae bacterium]|nr:hypothetical protein [Gemmatimonadaceae bacterium]
MTLAVPAPPSEAAESPPPDVATHMTTPAGVPAVGVVTARGAAEVLEQERDRAERLLNLIRAGVLVLLGGAASAYAPTLTPELNRANVLVLAPALAWTLGQHLLFYRRPRLPRWLALANPLVDVAAVTVILGAYATARSAPLGLKTPIFLAYFVVLASRPITSSTRRAGVVAVATFVAYAALVVALVAGGRLPLVLSPVTAGGTVAVSPLDEGARLLLLAVAGIIATYATHWQ